MNNGWIWVDTDLKREEAKKDLCSSSIICVDTEYDSFRYFRELLCLIQIEADTKTYLFDPFNDLDISFLGKIFAHPDTLKVMHAADNDIRIIKRNYGFEFNNIFDTHRAALILGCHYLSLSALIGRYLGIEFEKKKSMQRSQWENRPLTEEQLNYAVQDTAYLKELYYNLDEEIREKGLKERAQREFDSIAKVMWSEKLFDPQGYKNIKGYPSLTINQKRYLKLLFRWRFQKASETNAARFRILSDQNLLDLARMGIPSMDMLKYSGILPPEKANRYGAEIVEILNDSKGT